uniref:Sickle tail protein-like n=1 Tax=Acanthochromis polyacanthus TaxID=80966 RepID=A0A3Q1FJP9_9TELE
MSKSSSHMGRPGSAGSQSPNLKKELQGNRSCMLRIGERLMRAGSEGNLVQRPIPTQSQTQTSSARLGQRLNGKTPRPAVEDKPSKCTRNSSNKAPCSPSTLPRSYAPTAGASGRDSQLDSLMMQQSDVERKKEVFLDHLRHKYPHHAAIIMGHQDCMRDQVRSPRPSESPPCTGVSDLVEEQDPLAPETMSDGDMLPPSAPFTRGCKTRASLPVSRSNSETRERSPGVLYLQYGEETKQVRMPAEISTLDTLQALFVTAFPHQLSLKMLQSPNMAIYIKDTCRNIYYNLEDVRNITPQSFLKAYHKDPAHVFNRYGRPTTTEGRISKEILYGNHSPVHTLHSLQGSMSPPMVRSMPSSPSRMAFGGGGIRGGVKGPDSSTLPRERLVGAGRSSTLCTSSSAILERRDVKPDEDVGSSKSMALVVRAEGGHYQDSYCSSLQDGGGGRLSIASSQCSAPPSLTADMVDGGVLGIPGGLQQYRASIKPMLCYGETMEHQTRSLHRQKNRKFGDSQLPPLGTKTSSPSPHRAGEVRMIDGQIVGGVGMVSPERMSPIHRPLRRDSNGATVEVLNRSRVSGSSSSTSSVFLDSPLGQPERLVQGHVVTGNTQSDRMKAMEEQIASLAGLVHHALSMGPDVPGVKDTVSENAERKLLNDRLGMPSEPHNPASLIDSFSPTPLALQAPPSHSGLQQHLVSVKRNVCELRQQLNQLRQLQLSNQESVNSMVRMAGQELVVLMCDWLVQSEEASYRKRAEMEEQRIHYLATEERILKQLSELEVYVDHLQRSSTSIPSQSITLGDVEEGAVNLRRVGEALAKLKGVFPELQLKMRSVLRLEVEAVRFLKEEPHKMDSMLKRVKALTEILSSLRRCVSESTSPARSAKVGPANVQETDQGLPKTQSPQSSPKPQPRSSIRSPMSTSIVSGSHTEVGLSGSVSPIMAHRMKSTAAPVAQPSHHYPSTPLTPTHGRDSPTMTKVNPHSREGSPALQRRTASPQSDGLDQPVPTQQSHSDKTMNTERQTPEGCQSETSDMVQSSTSQVNQISTSDSSQPPPPNTSTNPDHVLQEAHGSLLKSIPDPDVSGPAESYSDSASRQSTLTTSELEQNTPLDTTLQEPQVLLSNTQEDTSLKLSDEVDSHIKPPDSAPAVMSPLPAATVEPLPSPARSAVRSAPEPERSSRPQMEKPRRSCVEKEMKQSPDKTSKSPPPPPPRRSHAVSSGFTTGRSGEVIAMKTRDHESGVQEKGDQEKEPPQPKPPRQPPEVKPKPQMCVPPVASSTSTPPTARAHSEEEEEEEEGHNKFMKELQVFQKCTVRDVGSRDMAKLSVSELQSKEMEPQVMTDLSKKNHSPGGNKQQSKGNAGTTKTSQVATQKMLATCEHQSALKFAAVAGLKEHGKSGKITLSLDKKKEVTEKKMVSKVPSIKHPTTKKVVVSPPVSIRDVQTVQKNEEVSTTSQKKADKIEVSRVPASRTENDLTSNTSKQINAVVGQVFSPTAVEKKVRFTTVVTLQKEDIQGTVTTPKQTYEKVVKEVPAEKKSNMTVVVTLQKENTPEHTEPSPTLQQIKSLNSDQDLETSIPFLKPSSLSPGSTNSFSNNEQNQKTVQISKDQPLCAEDGGTLSPTNLDDEGPPPPPPRIGKFSHIISKSRNNTQSKEEDLAKMNGSYIQTVARDSSGDPSHVGYENHGFLDSDDSGTKPIIVILNEPMDIQSAYKRLSTIFESEEDLDGILSPECIVVEEETKQEEEEKGVRNISVIEINTGLGLKGISKNNQNSPQMQHERSFANNVSVPENKDQGKPDSLRKEESKRKFKFRFPKNKLAAISQAIRTGTNKTGKKTLEVVVYEEEEEMVLDSRSIKENKKQTAESKSFEINRTKQFNLGKGNNCDSDIKASSPAKTRQSVSQTRVEELCKNAFDSINSLEESIKQLEISVDSISAPSSPSSTVSSPHQTPIPSFDSTDTPQFKGKVKPERERSPSKRPATQIHKGPSSPQSKRAKPQLPRDRGKTTTKKQTSSSSSSSSAQRSNTKSRHSSSSGSPDKTPKSQQQAIPKQPSQPRLVAISR